MANRIGLDFSAVGNHEFDRGRQELLRMQAGGCKQYTVRKPCQVERFTGADADGLEEAAVSIANDTIYGLAASVWTSNLSRAHRVSDQLRAGTVSVNTVDALSPMTPFGGFKQSGNGRDKSLHAFDKVTELKTTWLRIDPA